MAVLPNPSTQAGPQPACWCLQMLSEPTTGRDWDDDSRTIAEEEQQQVAGRASPPGFSLSRLGTGRADDFTHQHFWCE